MSIRPLRTLALSMLPVVAAAPALAQPLNLADGAYEVTLYDCIEDGVTCTGSFTLTGGAFTGVFLPFGPGNGTLGSVFQIQKETSSKIEFSLPTTGDLFWGALGYYQGPYTFLPPETMTWTAMGRVTGTLTAQGPLIGWDLENGPIYGPPLTLSQESIALYGGWASVRRVGDPPPPPPPSDPVFVADVRNLLLDPLVATESGGPGAIAGLQSLSPSLLRTMIAATRGDDQRVHIPVAFADPQQVPEPTSAALLLLGAVMLVGMRRRRIV